MASISNTRSVPGLGEEPSQHAGAQSFLAATIGLMSLGAPLNPSNSSSFKAPDAMAMDRFSVSERIAAMNRAAVAVVPPAGPSFSSRACEETEASLPTPVSLPRPPSRDSIEPVISTKNFPETLWEVISSEQYPDIVSWLPHGRGFVILDKDRFTSEILPRYFDGAKFPSYTRRMKRWSFHRVPRGPEMGAYYHENFKRDRPELVREMRYGAKRSKQENRKLEEKEKQCEKAAENKKVHKSLSNEVINAPPNNEPLGLPREDKYFMPRLSENSPKMNAWPSANPRESPMPLPSTLPKNNTPKTAAVGQKKMAIDAMGHREWLENQADSVWPSSFPPRPPRSVTPLHLNQRRIAEIEQELLLARSALSRRVADYVSSSRPIGAAGARSIPKGRASNYRPHRASAMIDTQIMIENERAKRILEAEIVREHCNRRSRAPTLSSNGIQSREHTGSDNRMCDIMASEIQASSKIHRDAMDAVAHDLQSRLKPSLVPLLKLLHLQSIRSGGTMAEALSGSRPVVMSRKEEEELARYLVLKRIL